MISFFRQGYPRFFNIISASNLKHPTKKKGIDSMFTVLHLDKSELIKKMVKDSLMGTGVKYLPADNTIKANNIINETKIDLIVTSIMIENDTIEEFIKNINKGVNKDTPVFIVTSDELDEEKKKILNLGVSDYIPKEKIASEIAKHIEILMYQEELMNQLKSIDIAIIDDSALDQAVTKDIFNKNGITSIDCYKSGIALMNSGKQYDLYIVDAVLKEQYGKSLIMQIRRNNKDAIITIVSSLNNSKTIAGLLDSGANDFIMKPVDENIFMAKLKSNMRVSLLANKKQ